LVHHSNLSAYHNNFDLLDATAAPGNKTTHLASLANSTGTVFACERDEKRWKILQSRTDLIAPEKITTLHMDYLTTESTDAKFANVMGILLDPSCSGSGIVSQPDRIEEEENEKTKTERLTNLSNFQLLALIHSMVSERSERALLKTETCIRATTKLTLFHSIYFATSSLGAVVPPGRPARLFDLQHQRRGERVRGWKGSGRSQ